MEWEGRCKGVGVRRPAWTNKRDILRGKEGAWHNPVWIKNGNPRVEFVRSGFFLFLDLARFFHLLLNPSPQDKWSTGDSRRDPLPMKNNNRPPPYFVFLVICALGMSPVFAESDAHTPTLGTVVVTATSEETPFETGDVETEESTGFVSVIHREDFEGKMEDLADVLQNEAAVEVRQSGGLGSFSTISIRGSSSDQVMVFLDGVLLNDASGGGVDLSSISLSDVESIEIYRGVTPINFDKASIGGVVNIKTLRAKEGIHASAYCRVRIL